MRSLDTRFDDESREIEIVTDEKTFQLSPDSPRTIGDWIRLKAERNGVKVALEIMGREKTYLDVDVDSNRVAVGIARLGLQAGDRAAIMMKNSLENVDVWFAMCKSGIIEVPVNTANRGHLLQYLLSQSQSRAIFVDEEFVERIAEIAESLPLLEHVIVFDEGRNLGSLNSAANWNTPALRYLPSWSSTPTSNQLCFAVRHSLHFWHNGPIKGRSAIPRGQPQSCPTFTVASWIRAK